MTPTGPRVTIVTVVKDDEAGLLRTLESVRRGLVDDMRWLVVDSSSHGESTQRLLDDSGVPYDYAWVPPAGVYPAMNAALERVKGDYAWFVNAGDRVHSVEAVADVLAAVATGPVWAFGRATFIDRSGKAVTPHQLDYSAELRRGFARGRFPPHQATVALADALRSLGGFDTSYSIAADYAVMLRLALLGEPAVSGTIWADFFEGGISTARWKDAVVEFHRARRRILEPKGWSAVCEWGDTAKEMAAQGAYRTLLAPGRPLGGLWGRADAW